jgi:hypothetical protein
MKKIKYYFVEAHMAVKVQLQELGSDLIIPFDERGKIPEGYRVHSVSQYAFDGIVTLNVVQEA